MNRKVLLICYYFPPLGMGGIGRPLNLFVGLPGHDWEGHVLTVKNVLYRAYEPELLASLDGTKIFRAGSRDPQRLLYLLGVRKMKTDTISRARRISQRFFPDSKAGWVKPAIQLGRTLCENYRYDCLISTAPPISAHLVGHRLSREFQIPWVADFRDYWTAFPLEESFSRERPIRRGYKLLDSIRRDAAAITTVNRTIAEYLGQGEIIPNGYDVRLADGWRAAPDDDHFRIGLLGHQLESYEVTTLLKTLSRLGHSAPELLEQIQIVQIGQVDPDWFRQQLSEHDLHIDVEFHGRLPRSDTVAVLSRAHMFYFGVTTTERADFLPGKTFDLLASGRPLLVNAPMGGEIHHILKGSTTAHFVETDHLETSVQFIKGTFQSVRDHTYSFSPLSEYAARYSSEKMVERFVNLMESLR